MVVYAEHYAGDDWLLRKIYEMEDDCVNFLACSDGTPKVQRLVTWEKPDDGFVKLEIQEGWDLVVSLGTRKALG